MCHDKVLDTVALYPHPKGPPARSKLKVLATRVSLLTGALPVRHAGQVELRPSVIGWACNYPAACTHMSSLQSHILSSHDSGAVGHLTLESVGCAVLGHADPRCAALCEAMLTHVVLRCAGPC
jgi:hypothetical protein